MFPHEFMQVFGHRLIRKNLAMWGATVIALVEREDLEFLGKGFAQRPPVFLRAE